MVSFGNNKYLYTFTIVATLVLLAQSSVIRINGEEIDVIKLKTLTNQTKRFQCKPQERSFLSKNFLKDGDLYSDETIFPNNIILHRCDEQSGCCLSNDQTCGPIETRKVSFELTAQKIGATGTRPIMIYETNHTICKCDVKSSPKRDDSIDVVIEYVTSTGLTFHTIQYYLLSFVVVFLSYLF